MTGRSAAFTPRAGAVRTYRCADCGLYVVERWHGAGSADYTTEPSRVDPCSRSVRFPGRPGAPHAFSIEVVA